MNDRTIWTIFQGFFKEKYIVTFVSYELSYIKHFTSHLVRMSVILVGWFMLLFRARWPSNEEGIRLILRLFISHVASGAMFAKSC